jgi:ring-1,2-phenylacetyl-CoA epoxidase subunit PaaC
VIGTARAGRVGFLIRHGDDNLVLAQRLGEWISRAPELEEDIAMGNLALDHLGQARALYSYAADLDVDTAGEDELAFLRTEREFMNLLLVEQPNGDFAHTMARQLFFDAYQSILWEHVEACDDPRLAGIAARASKETTYHLQHAASWVVRLGDGTEESHNRMQAAVDGLWRFTGELFAVHDGDDELGAVAADDHARWAVMVGDVLGEATVAIPDDPFQRAGGRQGEHTEHLGHLLAEMQWMQRTYPGQQW